MIAEWKRAIEVLNKLDDQELRLAELMRVISPIHAKQARKLALAHRDISKSGLKAVEDAISVVYEPKR